MAQERGYESQVTPRATAARPLATAESFGAGAMRALSEAGEQLHRGNIRDAEIERKLKEDRELADWSHKYALHRQNMDGVVTQARSSAGPGAAGHRENVAKANEAARETLMAGISSPRIKRLAQAQWDEYTTRLADSESNFEEGQRVAKVVTDEAETQKLQTNLVRRGVEPEAYKQELQLGYDRIDALQTDDATRGKLKRALENGLGSAFIQRLQDTDPVVARGLLDSGAFDHLDPDVLEQLRNGADVEIRRKAAELDHQAATEKAAWREKFATIQAQAGNGIEIPDQEIKAAIGAAEAMGDTSTAENLRGLAYDNGFAKVYRGQTPLQREQRLAALRGKAKPSEAEQREIKWLTDKRGELDNRFDSDPVGWAIENAPAGTKPLAGDITDPAVIEQRINWARTARQTYGRPMPYLTRAEATQLAQRREESQGGEREVLALLDRFPEGEDRAIAARQIAGNDAVFQHLAQLDPAFRGTIRAGADAIKANAKLVAPSESNEPDAFAAMAAVDARVDRALKEFSPADTAAVKTVARQFLAGVMVKRGLSAEQIDEATYDTAIRVALGGDVRGSGKDRRPTGGLGSWGGTAFVLPEGHDNTTFGQSIGNLLRSKPELRPVNPDGSEIPIGSLRPVLVGPNRYRWETPDGRVAMRKGGEVLLIDVRPRK